MSSPTTAEANGRPCPTCEGEHWQRVGHRARCTSCGVVTQWSLVSLPPTREQRQASYQKRHIRRDSDATEAEHAKRLGGRTTRGSGCGPFDKADVAFEDELHELKETRSKEIRLALADWVKVRTQSLAKGLVPLMALTFTHGRSRTRLVVMDIDDYEALKEAARAADNSR